MKPVISVIIPAHQEEKQIKNTLKSLEKQTYPDFEVIIVANGCTDKTADVIRNFHYKLNVTLIETRKRGIGFACNLGVKKANGKILVFLDADTILSDNAIYEIKKAIDQGFIGGTVWMKAKEKRLRYYLLAAFVFLARGAEWGPVRFVTRDIHDKIKGHIEDCDYAVDSYFATRLRELGKTKFIYNACNWTSMRRFEKLGVREMLSQFRLFLMHKLFKKPWPKTHPVVR